MAHGCNQAPGRIARKYHSEMITVVATVNEAKSLLRRVQLEVQLLVADVRSNDACLKSILSTLTHNSICLRRLWSRLLTRHVSTLLRQVLRAFFKCFLEKKVRYMPQAMSPCSRGLSSTLSGQARVQDLDCRGLALGKRSHDDYATMEIPGF